MHFSKKDPKWVWWFVLLVRIVLRNQSEIQSIVIYHISSHLLCFHISHMISYLIFYVFWSHAICYHIPHIIQSIWSQLILSHHILSEIILSCIVVHIINLTMLQSVSMALKIVTRGPAGANVRVTQSWCSLNVQRPVVFVGGYRVKEVRHTVKPLI